MKKSLFLASLVVIFGMGSFTLAPKSVLADEMPSQPTLRKDYIQWRYKVVDGYLYRRQYNYSKSVWIGSWEKC